MWESARSFDSFENVVSPSVSDVEELVIVSATGPYARGASDVSIGSVRRFVVGECVECFAWCGGVLQPGWSECSFRCSVCERVRLAALLV